MNNGIFLLLSAMALFSLVTAFIFSLYIIADFIYKICIAVKKTIAEEKEYKQHRAIIKYNFKRRMEKLREEETELK